MTNSISKLNPVGEILAQYLHTKFSIVPEIIYEYNPIWLDYSSLEIIEKYQQIESLYNILTDNKLNYKNRYYQYLEKPNKGKQSFDIWIGQPFNFAVEFDEKQHFNQFRRKSLEYYSGIETKFCIKQYQTFCSKIIKPNTSGFAKLKSYDPLFPEMLEGAEQDNRVRQRAFRDYLKDILPVINGYYPTLRIPFKLSRTNISKFRECDLRLIQNYIEKLL